MKISYGSFTILSLFGVMLLLFVARDRDSQVSRILPPIREAALSDPSNAVASTFIQDDIAKSRHNAITRAVEKLSPAIVGINATKRYSYGHLANDPFWRLFYPDRIYEVPSLGSGFIISKDGLVISNDHVVGDAPVQNIVVTTTDGDKHEVEWVRLDERTDIALLKIKGSGFPFATFGNSDDVIIGEWAIALGNPFGLFAIDNQPSVTVGVVSATQRDFGLVEEKRVYKDMIQTDASINPGNSGGPLANSLGEVIGVNTFIYTGSKYSQGSVGVGFAIPSNKVYEIVDELNRFGKIDRQFETGIEVKNVNRYIAYALGLKSVKGAYVSSVKRNSSGDKAGVEVGDIILSINDIPLSTAQDVTRIIRESELRPGEYMELEVQRENKKHKIRILLTEPER